MKKTAQTKILISLIILLSFYFLSTSPNIRKAVFGQKEGAIAQAQSLPTITVKSGHPRLFITPENLPTLKQRAATTHKDTYGALKSWCETNWNNTAIQQSVDQFSIHDDRPYDHSILRYALIYALGEIPGSTYSPYSITIMETRLLASCYLSLPLILIWIGPLECITFLLLLPMTGYIQG